MKTTKLIVPASLAAMAMVLSACGGPAAPSGNSTQGSAAPKAAGWQINEQPREKLAEGGEMVLPIAEMMTQWNGAHVNGNQKDNTDLQAPLDPQYMDYNASGDPVVNPDYLVSADVKNEGKTVVTLKLNEKAVWGDGKPLSVNDWIATWKALNGTNKAFEPASTDGWDQIESVTKGATDYDVTITFKSTYPDWTAIVASGPLRAESVATPEVFNKGWTTLKNEWLSGPYKVQEITKDRIVEVPNDKWWGRKPLLTKITFRAIPSDATASAFANGELDYYDIGPDPDGFARAKATPNAEIRKAGGPNFRHFTFNTKAPNLTDVKVRQAIAMGLDREAIAKSDLAGIDWAAKPLNNNVFIESQTGYKDQAEATGIKLDRAKAATLLDVAGWKMNDSTKVREKDGKPLLVKFAALTGVKASENEALTAQNQLKEIGVKIEIVPTPVADFASGKLLDGHNFDLVAFSWIGTQYPLRNLNQIYGTGSESNYAQLSNPALDELIKQINVEMDPAKRLELGDQAAKSIWESVHTLPLYQRPELAATDAKLANYGAFGLGSPKWADVGFMK